VKFEKGVADAKTSLTYLSAGLNILKATQQTVAILSGATAINVATAIVSSVAIDQLIEIEEARPRLETSLMAAKEPVDLNGLAAENAEDQLYYYWAKAMDTSDIEDTQLIEVAKAAYRVAEAKGFVKPGVVTPAAQPAVFRHTAQGATTGHTDTAAAYVTWDNSRWTLTLKEGIFTHTTENKSHSHTDVGINYLTWDNTRWTATLLPDGKTFRHVNTAGEIRESTTLNYKHWYGSNWTLSIDTPSLPPAP
jgi:hypothetical protein